MCSINLWFPSITASYHAPDETIASYFSDLAHAPEWDRGGTKEARKLSTGRWLVDFYRWSSLEYRRVTDGKYIEKDGARRVQFKSNNETRTVGTTEIFEVFQGTVTYRFWLKLSGWHILLTPIVYPLLLYELTGTSRGITAVQIPKTEDRKGSEIVAVTYV